MTVAAAAAVVAAPAAVPAAAGLPAALESASGRGSDPAALVEVDSVTALTASILPRLAELRGLQFLHPIPVRVESDSAARAYFSARSARDAPPETLRVQSRAAALLGLLPAGFDLEAQLLDLMQEQAAGYYDPESKTFVVLGDMPRGAARGIVVHELTHGLDDQHFNLDSLMTVQPGDDRMLALAAVIEGSATAVMSRYMTEQLAANRMSAADLAALAETDAGRGDRFQAAPPMIQRGLAAPYVLGMNFLLRGNPSALMALSADDLNQAFRHPPRSSEQVLHPQKYWDESQADEPQPVPALDAARVLGRDWHYAGAGELGELFLALLVDRQPEPVLALAARSSSAWTNPAAAGWGGDRWWLFENGARAAVVLATVWDTDRDADEFAAAVRRPEFQVARSGPWVVVVAGPGRARAAGVARAALKVLKDAAAARR